MYYSPSLYTTFRAQVFPCYSARMRKNTAKIAQRKQKRAEKNRRRVVEKREKFDAYIYRRVLKEYGEG